MRRIILGAGLVLAALLVALVVVNAVLASARDHPVEGDRLTAAELALAAEAERLRTTHGEAVWPGFADADLRMVVYNDRFEFLIGAAPGGWEAVGTEAGPYARRPADDPQAFAVDIGDTWAGSLPTEERMDRDYVRGMRRELPPVLAQLFPVWVLDITPDLWPALMVHEQVHALQAVTAPGRWDAALGTYRHEGEYPYDDEAFAAAWTAEGEALRAALDAPSDEAACAAVGSFLETRRARRDAARLTPDLVAFERDLEWLEGLAKHGEIRVYERAAAEPDATARGYRQGLPHWTGELDRLGAGIAGADGDLRFYISGMAQARVLDRLDATGSWRGDLGSLVLEEALAQRCGR